MNEPEKNDEIKASNRWKVVGYNMLALVGYTMICRFIDGGMFLDAFFIAVHFMASIVTSIVAKRWEWVLSAFLVLAIGFSSCVTLLDLGNMH
ncbi:hypothetical protein [Mucilaginibacter sp.]|jgi:hypothetical protein|uniref:hypothetical protein n=1 Tax=Mucilaginibacter sp. TaxID=1882438 RepID=UPI002D02F3A5|nr:hypothetical protein [Mucilaginibacter sp.]HTI57783.1 hypothetical protein [Mucilaginibacter sp.]